MKYTKRLYLLLGLGVAVVLTSFVKYFNEECISCSETNAVKVKPESLVNKTNQDIELKFKITEHFDDLSIKDKSKWIKKTYEDEWCIAEKELKRADADYAENELKDWYKLQGKALIRPGSSSGYSIPEKNGSIQYYEGLPLEQLEVLAYEGNKWAMVAFVKNSFADRKKQFEISGRMLVSGASYPALEFLVTDSLVLAMNSNSPEEANANVKKALIYVFWGLENYNNAAFNTFVAVTSQEFFIDKPMHNSLIINANADIKKGTEKLNNLINKLKIIIMLHLIPLLQ
jgi:hypothetical protein